MRIKHDAKTGNWYDEESGRRVLSQVFSPKEYRPRRRLSTAHGGAILAVFVIGGWLGAAAITNGRTWAAAVVLVVTALIALGLFRRSD